VNPKGKVALITGGAHRVGKTITMQLAEAGAHVVINYNSSAQAARQTAMEAEALDVDALAVQCDVSDYDAVQEMARSIHDRFGGVDIIVNAASLFGRFAFPTQKEEDIETWRRVTRISLDGAFYVCNSLAPSLLQRAQAAGEANLIINIVDLSIWQPWPNFMAHSVGKSGLMALTRQLALELAPSVRVNAIAPGPVLPPPDMSKERSAATAQRTLLQRWGDPHDVTKAVMYLVDADYVTGDVLTVDGGERYGDTRC